MKRSQMLREINWVLYGLFDHDELGRQSRAEEILKVIEEAGMKPPTINHSHNGDTYWDLNEWEEEH